MNTSIAQRETWRAWFLTALRIVVGWHLFYEGISKLVDDDWTALRYLAGSTGFLSGFYRWLADLPMLMPVIDGLNIFGLIFIGLGLFLGLYTRYAAMAGSLLMGLYYFAYPPFGPSAAMQPDDWRYNVVYVVLIVFFTYIVHNILSK